MKMRNIALTVTILLFVSSVSFADRQLDRAEILQIFQELTSQPRTTWIPAGTIEATHEEYGAPRITDANEIKSQMQQRVMDYLNNPNKRLRTEEFQKMRLDATPFNVRYELSNEHTMTSGVTLKYDGEKFYWETNIISRSDSVKPGKDLETNYLTDNFRGEWNAARIYVWDGQEYTVYNRAMNSAFVDSTTRIPRAVNGPLTAGIIPWGYGYYSYESLAAGETAAVEATVDGRLQIDLTLSYPSGSEMVFALDPAKDYAVIHYSKTTPGGTAKSGQFSDYQLVSGRWVPLTILLEQFEAGTKRLLARDLWNITAIDANTPGAESFEIEYEENTRIEHASVVTGRPAMYLYSESVDTDQLLTERLNYAASQGSGPQNCATASLKYAVAQLGKNVTDSQLASLVTEADKNTSLYAMKHLAEGLGLYCRAVQTDLNALRSLSNCQVILHMAGRGHFAVLASLDSDYVRIIDLASHKFYYRSRVEFFGMDWTDGTALLLSNDYISGNFNDIDESRLQTIVGASGYSCTDLLQEFDYITCVQIGGECVGSFVWFIERWGCELGDGDCTGDWMHRAWTSPCIEHPNNPAACTITGDWTIYYMWACD